MMKKPPEIIGIGHDGDGESRITKADEYLIVGGSEQTHEMMQETLAKATENAKRHGRRPNMDDVLDAERKVEGE